jgi:hypothetical protein
MIDRRSLLKACALLPGLACLKPNREPEQLPVVDWDAIDRQARDRFQGIPADSDWTTASAPPEGAERLVRMPHGDDVVTWKPIQMHYEPVHDWPDDPQPA